ncbi:hypothetical protein D8674_025843 [Pyrus ussuriensis x Pyrus communis]|uniref:Uncharacterized protein n=1 Tax=Pyrus ussuriensis x Pyrus communis TaxID=2448454 RepID=A0A5N5I6D3_9ROSA|nr:hypothetical protein D8674_025843 [Pyrus ussuriensis x Pyrus communis]
MDATDGNGVPKNLKCPPPLSAVSPTFYMPDSVPRLRTEASFLDHVVLVEFT